MTSPSTEQCVASLPPPLQERMARLVLGGWTFANCGNLYPQWKASHPNNWRRLYASTTLLTLLNQMEPVVQDTEAGVYEAFDMRGISNPEELVPASAWRHRAILPDAAIEAIGLVLDDDGLPSR